MCPRSCFKDHFHRLHLFIGYFCNALIIININIIIVFIIIVIIIYY